MEIRNKPWLQLLKLLWGIHNMWINDHKVSLLIFYISCLTHLLDPDDKNYQGSWRKMLEQYSHDKHNDDTEPKTNPLLDPDSDKAVSCTLYLCIFANQFVSMILWRHIIKRVTGLRSLMLPLSTLLLMQSWVNGQ